MSEIANTTMLVGISMGMCRQGKQLPQETSKLENEAGATAGTVGGTSKYYFKRKEGGKVIDGLDILKKFQSEWRLALKHYARYPFAAGMAILPAALVAPFMEENNKYMLRKANVWQKWVEEQWPHWSSSAATRMGLFYDASDFPTLEDCAERFTCEVSVIPLADSEKWNRITIIAPALATMMQQRQDAALDKVIKETHQKLWRDMMQPIQHLVEMLSKEKTKLYPSLIEGIISVADLVPAYAEVHEDEKLTALAANAKKAFENIDITELRKSAELQEEAKQTARELLEEAKSPYARSIIFEEPELEPQQ